MSSNSLSTAYQDAIESGDNAKIKTVINKMFMKVVELKIITEVDDSKEAIQTTINLLDGDITTKLHSKFAPDPQKVAEFHKEQVSKAEEIMKRNVDTLKSLADNLREIFDI